MADDSERGSGYRWKAIKPSAPDHVLVELAHRQAYEAVGKSRPGALPTIEQVCAELWRMGVVLSLGDLAEKVRALGLPVIGLRDASAARTRKFMAPR